MAGVDDVGKDCRAVAHKGNNTTVSPHLSSDLLQARGSRVVHKSATRRRHFGAFEIELVWKCYWEDGFPYVASLEFLAWIC